MRQSPQPDERSSKTVDGPVQGDVLFSRFEPHGIFGKIRNFPLIRIFIALVFLAPILAVNAAIVLLVIEKLPEPAATYVDIARLTVSFFAFLFMWQLYCGMIEKRDAYELSGKGSLAEFLFGVVIALSIVGLTVFVLYSAGVYSIAHFNANLILVTSFAMYMTGSLMQELFARLIIYRLTEEWLGTWVAIAISAAIFGLAHAANPNQTAISTFTLVITSFVFIGPFLLTRRVWMILGVHFGWNFTQTGIFGMPNSGIPIPGWITPALEGPEWLTGGSVGIENSALTVGLSLVVSALLLIAAVKRGQIVKPRWRRGKTPN